MSVTRPILRYHGGKWRIAPWIISHFPEHRIYVEPFGGGASVLMRKNRAYAEVYNDLDGEVVNVFRVLRDPVAAEELERLLWLTPYAREEFDSAYTPSDDPIEQARKTIVKSFAGYGSDSIHRGKDAFRTRCSTLKAGTGFRSDSNRSGTIPAHDFASFPKQIMQFCERLRGVVIECRDAVEVIQQHDREEALFYVDPPYVQSSRRDASHGYRYEMNDSDHVQLAGILRSVRGMVIVSGYPSPLYDRLYSDWRRVETLTRAHFAARAVECLWISPNVPIKQRELFEVTA